MVLLPRFVTAAPMPLRPALTAPSLADATSSLANELHRAGLTLKGAPRCDGKIHRVPTTDKPRSDNGWYSAHVTQSGLVFANFGDWGTGGTHSWSSIAESHFTPEDRAEIDARNRANEAERDRLAQDAAAKAQDEAARAVPADPAHPYLVAKGIPPSGALQFGADLFLPLRNERGEITTRQLINPQGEKDYLYGGRKLGSWVEIPGAFKGRAIICEGFATGASIAQATGEPVMCAMDTSGLKPCAEALRRVDPTTPILIAGDNDKSGAGQRYAEKAARAVTHCTAIWPEAEGEDFNDLARRAGLGAITSRLNGTRQERPPLVAERYQSIDPHLIAPRQWLYGYHLIRKFVSATIAPGGVGKSSLAIVEALAMVTGRKLLHHDVRGGPHRVWLFNLEDPLEELQRRIEAAKKHYALAHDDLAGRLFVNSGRDRPCIVATETRDGAIIVVPEVDALIAQIKENRIDVVIVDPFVSCHEVNENDNRAIDKVVKGAWTHIADATGCAIELVHHSRKSGGGEITSDSSRGASSLVNAARDARALNPMQPDEAKFLGLENHRGYFRTYSDKANLAPPADKSDWFQTLSVPLGNGDSVGVVTPYKVPGKYDRWDENRLKAVILNIGDGRYREDPRSPDWAGNIVIEKLDLTHDQGDRALVRSILKDWEKNGRIEVRKQADENRQMRAFYFIKDG